jgi:hypothetical protein
LGTENPPGKGCHVLLVTSVIPEHFADVDNVKGIWTSVPGFDRGR